MLFILLPLHWTRPHRGKKVSDGKDMLLTNFEKLGLGLNLKECTSSFAPASQQQIKILKPTNTRLKHQSEQFWVAEKLQWGRGAKAPRPLCSFLRSHNSSNCCLSLVFVGFNLLILCWLAGANDKVHYFKFNPYFLTFETLGIFQKAAKSRPGPKKSSFFKIALKRVLTLPKARSRREHSKSSGFIEIGLTCV